jgi:hypothetical protein
MLAPIIFDEPLPPHIAADLTLEAWLPHRHAAEYVLAELRCRRCNTLLSIECWSDRHATVDGRCDVIAHFDQGHPPRFIVTGTDHECDDGRCTG